MLSGASTAPAVWLPIAPPPPQVLHEQPGCPMDAAGCFGIVSSSCDAAATSGRAPLVPPQTSEAAMPGVPPQLQDWSTVGGGCTTSSFNGLQDTPNLAPLYPPPPPRYNPQPGMVQQQQVVRAAGTAGAQAPPINGAWSAQQSGSTILPGQVLGQQHGQLDIRVPASSMYGGSSNDTVFFGGISNGLATVLPPLPPQPPGQMAATLAPPSVQPHQQTGIGPYGGINYTAGSSSADSGLMGTAGIQATTAGNWSAQQQLYQQQYQQQPGLAATHASIASGALNGQLPAQQHDAPAMTIVMTIMVHGQQVAAGPAAAAGYGAQPGSWVPRGQPRHQPAMASTSVPPFLLQQYQQ